MKYGKGCIVMVSRSQFADGSYDPHMERPAMITLATDDYTDETYYLLITSQLRHFNAYPEAYFPLAESIWKEVGLKKPSLIKLYKVHKGMVNGKKKGGLEPALYREVIAKLKEYKEAHPDPIYDEIRINFF